MAIFQRPQNLSIFLMASYAEQNAHPPGEAQEIFPDSWLHPIHNGNLPFLTLVPCPNFAYLTLKLALARPFRESPFSNPQATSLQASNQSKVILLCWGGVGAYFGIGLVVSRQDDRLGMTIRLRVGSQHDGDVCLDKGCNGLDVGLGFSLKRVARVIAKRNHPREYRLTCSPISNFINR